MCRLLHLKIISLKNPLQIGLCNKAVSILNVYLSPVAIILPFIVMLEGGDSIGRGGAFYRLFTNSMLDLWILGALMFYTITYIFWNLVIGMPKMWISPKNK